METTDYIENVSGLKPDIEIETNKSSVYQKISEIQLKLLKHPFKTEQGYHGSFIPLYEMLPPVVIACYSKKLTLYFTCSTEHLILKIHSWDKKEEFSARVRLPELTKNEKDEGKNLTFLKRYVLMDVFQIMEKSVDPDSIISENNTTSDETAVIEQVNDYPPVINMLLNKYREKFPDKQAKVSMLNPLRRKAFQSGKITKEENREAITIIKAAEAEEKEKE